MPPKTCQNWRSRFLQPSSCPVVYDTRCCSCCFYFLFARTCLIFQKPCRAITPHAAYSPVIPPHTFRRRGLIHASLSVSKHASVRLLCVDRPKGTRHLSPVCLDFFYDWFNCTTARSLCHVWEPVCSIISFCLFHILLYYYYCSVCCQLCCAIFKRADCTDVRLARLTMMGSMLRLSTILKISFYLVFLTSHSVYLFRALESTSIVVVFFFVSSSLLFPFFLLSYYSLLPDLPNKCE